MLPSSLVEQAEVVIAEFRRLERRLATAESCTGGLIAGCLTEIAGSSAVVDRGFVTYSNEAKAQALGVTSEALEQFGAVSETVARQMAKGALERSLADVAVSVTGVAGPGGGSPEKPVGLVHFATATRDGEIEHREMRFGDIGRSGVRRETVVTALHLLLRAVRR